MASRRMRVRVFAAGCLASWAIFLNACQIALPSPALPEPNGVRSFLYQLQDIHLSEIGRTCFDLIVIDYSSDGSEEGEFTAGEIATLANGPGGPKVVLAYLSIGEAEDYRFYWRAEWAPGDPSWLDEENPKWLGNYKVHYWEAEWQGIVLEYVDRLIDAGFDGAYLDLIDTYEYYEGRGRATAASEMVAFVGAIRAHAAIRDPDFLIVVQNAAELAVAFPEYIGIVDGIGQEDIYYGYVDDDAATPAAVSSVMESHLDLFLAAGKLVLTIDYATTPWRIDDAYEKSLAKGYVPYVTTRDLDRLIVNPGHDPCSE